MYRDSSNCGLCKYSTVEGWDYPCCVCSDSSDEFQPKETDTEKDCSNCKHRYKEWESYPCCACDDMRMHEGIKVRGFETVLESSISDSMTVYMPLRGTRTSAGYDFYTTCDLTILPQQTVRFQTNIKAYMQEDEVLVIVPRSSTGFTHNLMLLNTVGIIDSDYYENPDNDGNIGVGLFNYRPAVGYGKEQHFMTVTGDIVSMPTVLDYRKENSVFLPKGTKIVQGIFMKFLEADNCNSDEERVGGVGSTGR